ncbi:hypothetical protein GCM10018790_81610 [Kitasatospora xanthocidica]|uniref:hypothetical protein n=1 Tax=Kitasatospora xanthocidica TaxID=83382 RepID=UPI0016775298|nr:hypothetical protein [Kitasatospora xanthocidica]GHF92222.1 hypothetical protein GCM10018790_81610 [Kitasatospora xanthocidica]
MSSSVTRVVGVVAAALVAVLGMVALSQSVSALTRVGNGPRVVAEAKLVEDATLPKYAPGLCATRSRSVEVAQRRPELVPSLIDETPVVSHASPAGAPEAPYGARRQSRAAVLQVFRC